MWDWLKNLGQYRDGLIIVTLGTYILGYIVKSIYSLRLNLGVLPLLDAQYAVAGLIPATIFLIIILLSLPFEKLPKPMVVINLVKKYRSFIGIILLAIVLFILIILALRVSKSTPLDLERDPLNGLLILLALIMYILLVWIYKVTESKAFKLTLVYLVVTTIMWVYIYSIIIYPIIPQALGGIRPRCAYLNLNKNGISQSTLMDLTIKSISLKKTGFEELRKLRVPESILQKLNQLLDKEYSSAKTYDDELLKVLGKNDRKKYLELISENLDIQYFQSSDEIILSSQVELIYSDDNMVVIIIPMFSKSYEIKKEVIPAIAYCD
jgi:hypothetical protein